MGPGELLLIVLIIILVAPKDIPKYARLFAKILNKINELKEEFRSFSVEKFSEAEKENAGYEKNEQDDPEV